MRFVLLAFVIAACTEPRSTACKEVCKREAECIDSTGSKLPFDEKECIAACANAPCAVVGTEYFLDIKPEQVGKIIDQLKAKPHPESEVV